MPELTKGNDASQASTAKPNSAESKPLNPMEFDEESIAKLLGEIDPTLKSPETAEPAQETEEAQPEAAAETEAQPDDGGTDLSQQESEENTPADETPEEPEEKDRVQKRIDQLTAKRREAEERSQALERELIEAKSQLSELQSNPAASSSNVENPLANVWDDHKLTEEWNKARNLRRWCEDNPEGKTINGREVSAEEIKTIKRQVEDAIDIHIPARADFLQKFRQLNPVAEAEFPWWKDRSSKEYAEASNALKLFPPLAARPDYKILLGWLIEGKKAQEARKAAAAAPKPRTAAVKPPPKQPSTPAAAPLRQNPNDKREQNKRNFLKTQSVKELEALVSEFVT